ncbi:MAG TPA: MogA/MoaB family molybdenum cofactor biosynthesis protein [Phycisphaerales bacterium]|nr:MogA/MoaB family molybdenum cofactor biosynthesis protein [Phycisphaerales bacterium]HMP36752.1 MogA/MoaB family molybdenum cofactor biosynthesis protein [Phycisphaerales bacterium]
MTIESDPDASAAPNRPAPHRAPAERADRETDSHPASAHEAEARASTEVTLAILTISDTRTLEEDRSGDTIARSARAHGHDVARRALVRDDPAAIAAALRTLIDEPAIDAIIATGGTGIGRRDATIEVVRPLLDIELEGFGELFRMLSHEAVGAAAMLSRAVGGVVLRPDPPGDLLLFALPGSVNAATLAMERLVAPQLRHMLWLRRGAPPPGSTRHPRSVGAAEAAASAAAEHARRPALRPSEAPRHG